MAMDRADTWLVVGGLGAVAFGYLYWKNKNDTDPAEQTVQGNTDTADYGNVLIPSYSTSSSAVVSSSQIYSRSGSSYNIPQGAATDSYSQTMSLPTNG